ncbi:hypothetical protein GCM10009759_13470 [Kitasatospora saccharophila]|uniref:Uncharacterized protein n=1 Tax=Kitasatospora saccharophila TaxID=407973 RepID=A0ABN2WEK3_9ACTN
MVALDAAWAREQFARFLGPTGYHRLVDRWARSRRGLGQLARANFLRRARET